MAEILQEPRFSSPINERYKRMWAELPVLLAVFTPWIEIKILAVLLKAMIF